MDFPWLGIAIGWGKLCQFNTALDGILGDGFINGFQSPRKAVTRDSLKPLLGSSRLGIGLTLGGVAWDGLGLVGAVVCVFWRREMLGVRSNFWILTHFEFRHSWSQSSTALLITTHNKHNVSSEGLGESYVGWLELTKDIATKARVVVDGA